MNLVLIGFMGTGKTTVGRKLAKKFGLKFVDTDHEIEKITGHKVTEIFKKFGEIRFRSEEKAAVRRIIREDNQVIATGGGVVLDPENVQMLKQNGITICLSAESEIIFQRVKHKKTRPLLQTANQLETINKLLAERHPYYQCAEFVLDTSERNLDQVVEEISKIYREKLRR
jgi:shikimate kinase